jgi:hypothetical protein
VRDRELEDAVAEELEPFVRRRALNRPRRVGERDRRTLRGERVDQRRKILMSDRVTYWCDET